MVLEGQTDANGNQLDADQDGIGDICEGIDQGKAMVEIERPAKETYRFVGDKNYELTNHLGNVLSVITDRKLFIGNSANNFTFMPDVLSYNDYYPFGSLIPNRHGSSTAYRYGFNGMEKDDELKGEGNSYDLGLRIFDPRIARMFKIDPRSKEYPWQSPYVYHRNSPLASIDYLGGGDPPTRSHTVKKGETLTSISKKYGVSIDHLAQINDIKDVDKISIDTVLSVLPEAHFNKNPYGGYKNPNDDSGANYNTNGYLANVGINFVVGGDGDGGARINNQIITDEGENSKVIKSLASWSEVKLRIDIGKKHLANGNKLYTSSYSAPTLLNYTAGKVVEKISNEFFNLAYGTDIKTEKYFTPIHVLGSFSFSMRLNGDGKTATVAIFDSKTISSFSDNKLDKSNNKSDDGALSSTYQRYIWTINLEK
ncbi:hypothetical protein BWK59_14625 [Flavobacterium davisii]|uniref:LysM domain-containing protein n=1 Tax=Flavobacterium davisii TaxID=2906077 RepID=A0A246GEW5_9FLAO|nr:LysM peptidoglycan-binding domain-containing protein [Flavobacterium davisii]OWP82669.1 hypothetical protein BWK59_14625 [Flavobacterium davisii]